VPDGAPDRRGLEEDATMETAVEVVAGIVAAFAVFALLVWIFQWLWNITAPEVFGLSQVTFWQALRVLVLASILFGGNRVVDIAAPDAADEAPGTTGEAGEPTG
jgi:hypothetical protein